ncbi:MAG: hypothetical protein ACPGRZ_00480 [Alphaproteobacteria bacterium]
MRRIFVFCAVLGGQSTAQVGAAPLAETLPSPAGKTVQQIRDLAPGRWLDLGRPAPDAEWGYARGRAWTAKMAYSKALGGAFLFGEGVHGWHNRANGRYMDGLWLYDVNAHRWVNLYPGTDTRRPPRLTVTRDGFEGVSADRPVPIATMVHGYQMTAWDPRRQLFHAMPNLHGYVANALPSVARFRSENKHRLNKRAASPWMFDPWNRRWHRLRTAGPSPRSGYGHVLAYLPNSDRLFHYDAKRVAYYLPDRNTWTYPAVSGPRPPFGIDPTACHDPQRDRMYIGGGSYPVAKGSNAFWIYDTKNDHWIDPAPTGSPGGNSFNTNIAVMTCETRNDRVLVFRHAQGRRGVYIFDAAKNAWRPTPVDLPDTFAPNRVVNGFYHPELNVHLLHVSRDSEPDGRIFVFRSD